MQQELGRDGVPVAARAAGPTVVLVSAGLLLAALGAAAVLLFPVVEEVRCLGFWDDGTKVAISPATRVDACRWLERSPCYPAGFSDQAPVRHVFFDDAPLDLLRLAYDTAGAGASEGPRVERCGGLTSLVADGVPEPGQLLSSRLKEARVELRYLDGRLEALTRSGERFTCGRGRTWCWVGPSTSGGVPIVRAHLVQNARVLLSFPKRGHDTRLALRFGFTAEGERLRTPLLGFARLRVRAGGRTLFTRAFWPGLGDRGAWVDLTSVPEGGTVEVVLEGLGARFGEVWLFGRFGT